MNYYETIKNKIIDNEVYDRVKNYSKEKRVSWQGFKFAKKNSSQMGRLS